MNNINANHATDLFIPQLLDNMVDTCHCCHCCWYCVSLLHVWSQVLLSVASHFRRVLFIWRPSNVKPKPPQLSAHCLQRVRLLQQEKEGNILTECCWDTASGGIQLSAFIFIVWSLSLWLFSIMLNKGAQLKPLPAVEPDTHICHCSHTYWRYNTMNQQE